MVREQRCQSLTGKGVRAEMSAGDAGDLTSSLDETDSV